MDEMISIKPKRKNVKLIILAVIFLTAVAIGSSYSAFFSVESQSTIQQIKAGVLDVVIDNYTITTDDLFPMEEESMPTDYDSDENLDDIHSTISLVNNGDMDAEYSITFVPDTLGVNQSAADYDYIIISVIDADLNEWHNFGTEEDPVYSTPLSSLENNGVYPILRDTIDMDASKQYRVYFWLSGDVPVTEIGKLVYLKFVVKSMTIDGRIED